MMTKIRVKLGQMNYFRARARSAAPLEIQAYLIGVVTSPELTIVRAFAYARQYEKQETGTVSWTNEEFERVKKSAEKGGMVVVGDIHSHPNYWPVLSPHDHAMHIVAQHRVSGVYAFMERKSTVCFWSHDSALPMGIEYV